MISVNITDIPFEEILSTASFILFGIFGAPKTPEIPPAPAAPKLTDPAVEEAKRKQRQAELLRTGRGSTILTSPLGTEGKQFQDRGKTTLGS